MAQLDAWVARHGSGDYERDAKPMDDFMLSVDAGIQQDRKEIKDFIAFVIGLSHDPATVSKTYHCVSGGLDLLFIDGDHQYASVLMDWFLYSPLVKPGGLVAFHDAAVTVDGTYGVPIFLERLARGEIDGQPWTLQTIIHTKHLGMAFYEKT